MISVTLNYELERLRKSLALYSQLSGKTESEVIAKHAVELKFKIRAGMGRIAPSKGAVRAERLSSLRSGGGIQIRPAVIEATAQKYGLARMVGSFATVLGKRKSQTASIVKGGKRMNFWALAAERELNLRESGRGFMKFSTPPAETGQGELENEKRSRYGWLLSTFKLKADPGADFKYAELKWSGGGRKNSSPVEGLQKDRAMQVLVEAVREANENIMVYLRRHIDEDILKAGLR
ncbi:MAG: hypothetical protein U1F98_06270 [Verrucomicrobiota bacterium]